MKAWHTGVWLSFAFFCAFLAHRFGESRGVKLGVESERLKTANVVNPRWIFLSNKDQSDIQFNAHVGEYGPALAMLNGKSGRIEASVYSDFAPAFRLVKNTGCCSDAFIGFDFVKGEPGISVKVPNERGVFLSFDDIRRLAAIAERDRNAVSIPKLEETVEPPKADAKDGK